MLEQTANHYTTGKQISSCGNEGPDDSPNNVYGYGGIQIDRAIKVCSKRN